MLKIKLISLASFLLVAGTSLSTAVQAADNSDQLVIGVIEDRSGGATFYSQESVKAIKLFADMINRGQFLFSEKVVGNKSGILGKKVELIFEDDQNNPNVTIVKARRLLERGAKILFFLSGSGATTQGRVVCAEQHILCMAPTNVSAALVAPPNNEYIFTIAPQASATAAVYVDAWKKLGYKSIAGVRDSTATSKIVGDSYVKAWEAAGFKTAAYETIEVGAPDANAQLLRVRSSKPDAIIDLTAAAAEAASFYRSKARLGIKTPIFSQNALTGSPHIWSLAGKALDGTIVVDAIGPSNPNTKALKAVYDAKYGHNSMVWLHPVVWDALMLVKKVVETVGSTDGTATRDAMENISKFPSAFGQPGFTLSFSKEHHNGTTKQGMVIVQFKNATPSVVWSVYQP